jgi:disulfide bond formation protein DsbB
LRTWFLIVLGCSSGLLGFALYQQYQAFLDPCPLCILQRLGFLWIALVALVAALHDPGRTGARTYGVLVALGSAVGGAVAGRHVWLQNLPPDQVPECGPGLNYMLENFPLTEVVSKVLFGSGSCAEVHWTFLGLSMPGWTLTWFLLLGLGTLYMAFRRPRPEATG